MKNVKFGDILSVESGLIIQGCNAQGKMNSGIARAIRDKYPEVFEGYEEYLKLKRQCHEDPMGTCYVYKVPGKDLHIVCGITQENYGKDGKKYVSYSAIANVFETILSCYGLQNVHYPMIGAGLGGGDWAIISEIIDTAFENLAPDVNRTLWILE